MQDMCAREGEGECAHEQECESVRVCARPGIWKMKQKRPEKKPKQDTQSKSGEQNMKMQQVTTI